jgi:hypothetical protein
VSAADGASGAALWRRVSWLPGTFAVCRLASSDEIPSSPPDATLFSLTRTAGEVSVVCAEGVAPPDAEREMGWKAMRLDGPLPIPFEVTGVLAGLAAPLAAARIPIFAISTFETDYVLVRARDAARAEKALESAGFTFLA